MAMTVYRKEPRIGVGAWLGILAIVSGFLLAPGAIWLVAPTNKEYTQVVLGDQAVGYTVPMRWNAHDVVACDPVPPETGLGAVWDCAGTQVETMLMETGEDPTVAIRRWMRAYTLTEFSVPVDPLTADVYDNNGVLILPLSDQIIGISVDGTGDHEGSTIFVYISGEHAEELADVAVESIVGDFAVADGEVEAA